MCYKIQNNDRFNIDFWLVWHPQLSFPPAAYLFHLHHSGAHRPFKGMKKEKKEMKKGCYHRGPLEGPLHRCLRGTEGTLHSFHYSRGP